MSEIPWDRLFGREAKEPEPEKESLFEVVEIRVAACPNPAVGEKQSLETVIGHAPTLPEADGLAEDWGLDPLDPVPEGVIIPQDARDQWFISYSEVGEKRYYVRETQEPVSKGSRTVGRIIYSRRENLPAAERPEAPRQPVPWWQDLEIPGRANLDDDDDLPF